MLTLENRGIVSRKAYDAIKAMNGRQEKLSLFSYRDLIMGSENRIVAGEFRFYVASKSPYFFYDIIIEGGNIVSVIPESE